MSRKSYSLLLWWNMTKEELIILKELNEIDENKGVDDERELPVDLLKNFALWNL